MDAIELFTDFGNAKRLIENNINNIRYCKDLKKWLIWNGRGLVFDDGVRMIEKAIDTIRKISEEVTAAKKDPDLVQQLLRHTVRSQTPSRLKAMIISAHSNQHGFLGCRSHDAQLP